MLNHTANIIYTSYNNGQFKQAVEQLSDLDAHKRVEVLREIDNTYHGDYAFEIAILYITYSEL